MTDADTRPDAGPFTAFNFAVDIVRDDAAAALMTASFAECGGIELGMQIKTWREGGRNDRQILLAGPATPGQVTLRRGMTGVSPALWPWMSDSLADPSLRAEGEVLLLAPDGRGTRGRFKLSRGLPVRLKRPCLNVGTGTVVVEELQIACERIRFEAGRTG